MLTGLTPWCAELMQIKVQSCFRLYLQDDGNTWMTEKLAMVVGLFIILESDMAEMQRIEKAH